MTQQQDDFVLLHRDDVIGFNEDNILPESPISLAKITAWLSPTAYDSDGGEFRKHLASHAYGTGDWLTSTPTYQEWHESMDHGLLWIKGIPGSGKSVFAAQFVRRLQEEDHPVLFFFFRQIIDANHSPRSLLIDWLAQVLRFSPHLQRRLHEYVEAGKDVQDLSMVTLWADLRLALSHLPRAYVIADALDEMDTGNETFLRELAELGHWKPAKVKVLMTSRPVATVEAPLRNVAHLQIRLAERLVDVDIATYVANKLEESAIASMDCEKIKAAVPGRANGLFLYARLAMDAFLEPGANIRDVLQDLPADLNTLYQQLLSEHARRSSVSEDFQLHVLQWVTHASRPLRLLELAEMVNTTGTEKGSRDLKACKALVRTTCGPLIEILPDETVSVVHHSLTEFLKGTTRASGPENNEPPVPILAPGTSHVKLALACLEYVQACCLDSQLGHVKKRDSSMLLFESHRSDYSKVRMKFPFLDYAATNWYIHAGKATAAGLPVSETTTMNKCIDKLLQAKQRRVAWLEFALPVANVEGATALHAAAWTGVSAYVSYLLSQGTDGIDAVDAEEQTPLHCAVHGRDVAVVQSLVAHGAKLDEPDHNGHKPLHLAADDKCAGIARLLLEAGVDPLTPKTKETGVRWCGNAPSSIGLTPLEYACSGGHVKAVLEFKPFIKPESAVMALAWAAISRQPKVVDILMDYPNIDVDGTYEGATALFHACKALDIETIGILLKRHADPNHRCENYQHGTMGVLSPLTQPKEVYQRGYTPMHAFAGLGRDCYNIPKDLEIEQTFGSLLNAGGDIHALDRNGATVLSHACSDDSHPDTAQLKLAELLLNAGANANQASENGDTPLHLTAKDTSGNMMRLLLERGKANINARDREGRTPLLRVLDSHEPESVMHLLEYGPDCRIVDSNGDGPLHYAMASSTWRSRTNSAGENDVLRALIAAGAAVRHRNHKGQTAVHKCPLNRMSDVSILCEIDGALINVSDHQGQSPLLQAVGAASSRDMEAIEKMVDLGARLDTRDFRGRSVLHVAVRVGDLSMLQHLLCAGLAPTIVSYAGDTLLHEATRNIAGRSQTTRRDSPLQLLESLVQMGIDPSQVNNDGRNLLHVVCMKQVKWPRMFCLQPIDIVLRVCREVNKTDKYGLTPLHIASTIDLYAVGRLLEAGSDPRISAYDGMTVLHLAARACQSNIIGMLLDHVKSCAGAGFSSFVDGQDENGRTALHHACRSGRYESVELLLQARADPNLVDKSGTPPIGACAEFEIEQSLWKEYVYGHNMSDTLHAAGLTLDDTTRPYHCDQRRSPRQNLMASTDLHFAQQTTRLEEIIDLLVEHGADLKAELRSFYTVPVISKAYRDASRAQHDYTAMCFRELCKRSDVKSEYSPGFDKFYSDHRFRAAGAALVDLRQADPERHPGYLLKQLLAMRQFSEAADLLKADDVRWHPDMDVEETVEILTSFGYARFLRLVASTDAPKVTSRSEHQGGSKPFLITACERELPNMDVVRILIEDFHVDMNSQHYKRVYRNGYEMVYGDSALHTVAHGNFWWHLQALEYLLEQGANIEIRDEEGRTPLHCALDASNYGTGYFHKQAARILIDHGADLNATDRDGDTCLAKAGKDVDLLRLLIERDARVTASAIFAAIDNRSPEILEVLLSNGMDPNSRRSEEDLQDSTKGSLRRSLGNVPESEVYPLHYAAVRTSDESYNTTDADRAEDYNVSMALVSILLKHGADPFATFQKRRESSEDHPQESWEHTIIHTVVPNYHTRQSFLDIPSLDINVRDSQGRTLLMAASANMDIPVTSDVSSAREDRIAAPSVADVLLSKGADLHAVDNTGKNILHLHFANPGKSKLAIDKILSLVPDLLHQADHEGYTPFHDALRTSSASFIGKLVNAGADVVTPDPSGNTTLHRLARSMGSNNEEAQRLFEQALAQGVPIDARNHRGETSFYRMVADYPIDDQRTRYEPLPAEGLPARFATALASYTAAGADVFTRNDTGQTVLHAIASRPISDMVIFGNRGHFAEQSALLFQCVMGIGLDPMDEDSDHRTCIDIAAACGHERIVKLFEAGCR